MLTYRKTHSVAALNVRSYHNDFSVTFTAQTKRVWPVEPELFCCSFFLSFFFSSFFLVSVVRKKMICVHIQHNILASYARNSSSVFVVVCFVVVVVVFGGGVIQYTLIFSLYVPIWFNCVSKLFKFSAPPPHPPHPPHTPLLSFFLSLSN